MSGVPRYSIYDKNNNKTVSSGWGCNIRRRKETPFNIQTLAGQVYELMAEPCDTVETLKEFIYEYMSELITGTIKTNSFTLFIIRMESRQEILKDNNVNLISILDSLGEDKTIHIYMNCNESLDKEIYIDEEEEFFNKSNSMCVLGDFIYKICVNIEKSGLQVKNHNIVKINRNDGTYTVFARFNNPYGICTDGTNFYVTDSNKIRVLNESGRLINTFNIPEINDAIPTGICVSGNEIYVLNVSSSLFVYVDRPIMVFDKRTGRLNEWFGVGKPCDPLSICVSETNIYMGSKDMRIYICDKNKEENKKRVCLVANGIRANSMCVSKNKEEVELYIVDRENNDVNVYRKDKESGQYVFNRQFGSTHKKGFFDKGGFIHEYTGYIDIVKNDIDDQLYKPYVICLSPDEKELYVADYTKQIKVYKTSC
jgi:hypothetical protein